MDDPRTVINVKAVSIAAWEKGKAAAAKADETMGTWLSRALNQLADREAGERYIPPAKPVKPDAVPGVDLHDVAAVLVAMGQANIQVQKRVAARVNGLLFAVLPPARLIPSLTAREKGKATAKNELSEAPQQPAALLPSRHEDPRPVNGEAQASE